ncbi:S-adenosyl-L-methionine-dependent methyltransferase [Ramicandelaber brevisporus]|nr:S-adenosyl-L-methionine-dependent methyltransferase [Ramicandelaber brevisporus]
MAAGKPKPVALDDTAAASLTSSNLESTHVTAVYNRIAAHFSQTRYKAWPVIEQFLKDQPSGSVGADIGCGNGKYLGVNPQLTMIASDQSTGLIGICKQRGFPYLAVADNLALPFLDEVFDFAISIAVIHHMSTTERRQRAVGEILRCLKRDGGRLLIFVWALEQSATAKREFSADKQDYLVPWKIPGQPAVKENGETNEENVHYRFYHMFKDGELDQLVKDAGTAANLPIKIIERGYDRDNWFVIVERC